MSFYETSHARTAGLHYEGPNRHGAQITVDAAELTPGRFEIVVLRSDGYEIETASASNVHQARTAYLGFIHKYVDPEPAPAPLAGKYAQLRDDLAAALAAGRSAEDDDPEDGGACNFDAASLALPRWKESLVRQAAAEAGTGCFSWVLFGSKRYVFTPNTRSQGNARTRNAEAMTAELRRRGYDALDYSQMD